MKQGLCTIVIKLGTSSIVHEKTYQPLIGILSSIVETVVHLRSEGHKVVLVSSGAIGVGLNRMDMPSRPKSLSGKQALAAIGQGRLIALWDNLFGQLRQPIAQVLLTRGDISDRTRYLNAVNTFRELLAMGVVPIVNENDTVSVSEIKFGDNDTLSAITSSMIHADYLFLLTDVHGLYTSNPRKDQAAKLIEVVPSVSEIRSKVSTHTLGSSLGTGGMETKLIAAEIATEAGVTTIIVNGANPWNMIDIIKYQANKPSEGMETSVERTPVQNVAEPSWCPSPSPPRPPHTVFLPSPSPLRDLKSWTGHTLHPSGSVVIDAGAHYVLSQRESGGRLLPAGVTGVIGAFASGQAVRIVIQRQPTKESSEQDFRSSGDPVLEQTRPGTPNLLAIASLSSSISSLDAGDWASSSGPATTTLVVEDEVAFVKKEEMFRMNEKEMVEVGRGLAMYNSAQIMRVRGLNSSQIAQMLGYADSEYVVENITIRVLPANREG